MTFDIIIIGSGLAGYTLIKEFRRLDTESSILVISADDGRYYSKPMLSTGFAKNKSAAELAMKTVDQMTETFNITVFSNTFVTNINRSLKTVIVDNQDQHHGYKKSLIFATGAAPIQIPLPSALNERCMPINDLHDYHQFRQLLGDRKKVAIIGAGLVGTEYANDLSAAGIEVDVIALDDRPLQLLLPEPLSMAVQDALSQHNIHWHFNNSITAAKLSDLNDPEDKIHLTLSSGKILSTDVVLSAVGLKPRIELAKQSGLTVDRGIVVDQQLKTTVEGIYALGDCAQINGHVLMYVTPLTLCAKALAKTLSGTPTEVKIPASPVIVKTPACPVVSSPASHNEQGSWHFEGQAPDLKATYVGEDGRLYGFALTGKKVMERMKLTKQLPPIIG
ncbi:MAG: rubredoxin-NAD+ reductase [Alteromonadaceae bacterium]|jgi:rubredoxin-NAD+ reductase